MIEANSKFLNLKLSLINYKSWVSCYCSLMTLVFNQLDIEDCSKVEILELYEGMTQMDALNEEYSR